MVTSVFDFPSKRGPSISQFQRCSGFFLNVLDIRSASAPEELSNLLPTLVFKHTNNCCRFLFQVVFSFLSFGWGLIADIDIESERLRMIGSPRFTIWSMARLIGKLISRLM